MGSVDGEDEPTRTASYCPNCGSAVDEDDSYCGKCGHDLSRSPGATEQDLRQFRARVSDHVAQGWDIEYDAGNEVALVDRQYGSVAVHILLFPFTSGVGNLLYGWYHYEHNADRKVIRAGGQDSSPPGQTAESEVRHDAAETAENSLSNYVWGLLLVVLAVASLTSIGLSAVGVTVALAFLMLAMLVLPPTRNRIDNRHPPTTFGPTTSVDERFVSDTDKPCSVCFDRVETGVKREYDQSSVFAGLPLYTIERGENYYCESCREEITDADAVPADSLDAELAAMDLEQDDADADAADSTEPTSGTETAETPTADTPETATSSDGDETTLLEDES